MPCNRWICVHPGGQLVKPSPREVTHVEEHTAPLTMGSPFSHQTGSGRIASPMASTSSGESRMVVMTCWKMELESRSWLAA